MNQPLITYNKDGSLKMLEGADAMQLMRVQTIISGIAMNLATNGAMVLTRGATITKLLAMATEYTGKKYSARNDGEKQCAMIDLQLWFNLMKSTIPTITR